MMGDYCRHSILPLITADGEIAAKGRDPYSLKRVRALRCVNVADGSFTTGTSRPLTIKWMKEHAPNLPAVFDGLRKAGLPEE